MNEFKSMFYNNRPEIMFLKFSLIPLYLIAIVNYIYRSLSIFAILAVLWLIDVLILIISKCKRKKYNFFTLSYSMFKPKYVWINQNRKVNSDKEKCPRNEIMQELYQLKKELPDGKIYMCKTQEHIAKQIRKNYVVVKEFKSNEADLEKLKKQIKNKKCGRCTEDCPIRKSEKVSFYAMMFTKKEKDNVHSNN